MFERFTRPARTVVETATTHAQQAAARETRPEHLFLALRHNYIGTEHLLLGLVCVEDRVVADTLAAFDLDLDLDALRGAVAEAVRKAG